MNVLDFKINGLDHIALRVKDLEISAAWYQNVLGLKKYEPWGVFPIFLLAGTTGIALFPSEEKDIKINQTSRNVGFDHFAFNVSNENFAKARKKYEALGIEYRFSDHQYFHSIYTFDPDGYEVELTTLMVPSNEFY